MSILGVICYIFCVYTWKLTGGSFFDLYQIFITFAFLFNYGQSFMWALGIHSDYEIGIRRLFSLLPPLNTQEIVASQMVSLMGLLAFHCGAVIINVRKNNGIPYTDKINIEKEYERKNALYRTSIFTVIISGLCAIFEAIRIICVNSEYGYGASLYDTSNQYYRNNYIILLSYMFFPSLIGLLIGSEYKKKVVNFVYISFGIYSLLHIAGGDRGEWLYPLIILVWMHHIYCNKLEFRKVVKYFTIGYIFLVFLVGIRNARLNGFSIETLFLAISAEKNPLSSAFFEMGQSMSVVGFFIRSGWHIYPYGNTYILAIFGMVTEKLIKLFIPEYTNISAWLSQDYLGIKNSGIGFSLVGEAYENFGPYLSIISLFIMGVIFSRLFTFTIEEKNRSLIMFFKISTAYALINATRNQLLTSLKLWTFSTGLILITLYVVTILKKQSKSR